MKHHCAASAKQSYRKQILFGRTHPTTPTLTYTRNTATKYSEKLLILFRNEMSDKIGMALLLG